jgi:hypothetical protein
LARLGTKSSAETIAKIKASWSESRKIRAAEFARKALGVTIFLYSLEYKLIQTFISSRLAAKHLNVSPVTVLKYARSNAVLKTKYILSLHKLTGKS